MKKINLPKDRKVRIDFQFSLFSFIRRFAGIAIIVILAILYFNNRRELIEKSNLYDATQAELELWIDKDGVNRARIQTLETSNTKEFLKLATKDSAILELQASVKEMKRYLKKQGSITNFSTQTGIKTSSDTEIIPNQVQPEFPIYKSLFDLKDEQNESWVFGETIASKDSTFINLKVRNKYSLTLGLEPTGFLGLGKGKPFADVKNFNPYSTTESLRTYQVSVPKPKRFGLGLTAAYGVGPNLQTGWFIGVGGSYQLIQFKL